MPLRTTQASMATTRCSSSSRSRQGQGRAVRSLSWRMTCKRTWRSQGLGRVQYAWSRSSLLHGYAEQDQQVGTASCLLHLPESTLPACQPLPSSYSALFHSPIFFIDSQAPRELGLPLPATLAVQLVHRLSRRSSTHRHGRSAQKPARSAHQREQCLCTRLWIPTFTLPCASMHPAAIHRALAARARPR